MLEKDKKQKELEVVKKFINLLSLIFIFNSILFCMLLYIEDVKNASLGLVFNLMSFFGIRGLWLLVKSKIN